MFQPGGNTWSEYGKNHAKIMYLVTHPRGRTRSCTADETDSIPPEYHEIDWKLKKTGVRTFLPGGNTRQKDS